MNREAIQSKIDLFYGEDNIFIQFLILEDTKKILLMDGSPPNIWLGENSLKLAEYLWKKGWGIEYSESWKEGDSVYGLKT